MPLTRVPLVEPRSTTKTASPSRRTWAWRRETFGSSRTMAHSGRRPTVSTSCADTARAVRQGTRASRAACPRPRPASLSMANVLTESSAVEVQVRPRQARGTGSPHGRRARARRLDELASRDSPKSAETLVVVCGEETLNWLGTMKPWTPTRAAEVHLARQPTAELDRAGARPRNAFANAPSTRRSRRCSNCWSPMVHRLPVR